MRLHSFSKNFWLFFAAMCLAPSAALAAPALPSSDDQTRTALQNQQGLHTAWVEQADRQSSLIYQLQNPAGQPLGPRIVIYNSEARLRRPHIAVDADRTVHLLWQERFAKGAGAQVPHGTWVHYAQVIAQEQPAAVHRQILNQRPNAMHPELAVDARGAAYVVWEEADKQNAAKHVMLAKVAGDQPVKLSKISASLAKEGGYPAVAVDRRGNLHLAWTKNTASGGSEITYATLLAANLSSGQTLIEQPLYAGAKSLGQPKQISINQATGQIVVAWQNRRGQGPLGRMAMPVNSLTVTPANGVAGAVRVFDRHLLPSLGQSAPREFVAVVSKYQSLTPARSVIGKVQPQADQPGIALKRFDDSIEKLQLARLLAFSSWSSAPPADGMIFPTPSAIYPSVPSLSKSPNTNRFNPFPAHGATVPEQIGLFSSKEVSPTTPRITESFMQELVIESV